MRWCGNILGGGGAGHEALFLGGMWTRRRGDNCQESGVPGVTAEKPQTVISGYLNMIEVVGFLFRYL